MKLTTAFLILACANSAAAQEASCTDYGDLAQAIMYSRQDGMPLAKAMALAEGNTIVEAFVLDAYDQPFMFAAEGKDMVIREFRNTAELICYDVRRKQ